ncbi:hypothetical protein CEXT_105111 [Caerostris extrusa]|uniref:Maturase K n=1 Tax=Caerostris extrusa TaxID=172846 RepID=A0AAV4Q505_CAEEX|nr:hypothetical protein CEXT_105111 [Caerostris extrusa]
MRKLYLVPDTELPEQMVSHFVFYLECFQFFEKIGLKVTKKRYLTRQEHVPYVENISLNALTRPFRRNVLLFIPEYSLKAQNI